MSDVQTPRGLATGGRQFELTTATAGSGVKRLRHTVDQRLNGKQVRTRATRSDYFALDKAAGA